jgi:hypothetical protein
MSQAHPGMLQECERERWPASHTPTAQSNGAAQRREIRRAEIGQFARLQVSPQQLDGVEIWGVRGEPFDLQPLALRGEVGCHSMTLVRAQPIPDQDDALIPGMLLQGSHEADERRVGVRARVGLKVQPGPSAIPPKREGGGDRQPFPIRPGMAQDRCLAAGRPRAPHDRLLRDATFVLEDYPGVAAPRVFFTCRHRWRRHCRIATSSRSRAWRAGRCSDQFNPRRMRQTWAG